MFKKIFKLLFDNLYIFTCAYSNNTFKDPLSKEEENMYLEKAKLGDKYSRDKLIEHNLRLVAHIVKKYDHSKEDVDDLLSIGTIGLIKGVDSYTIKKGVKLTTYCAKCIENEILMHFRSNKKISKNISLNEAVGFDKDGNEITLLDLLKTPNPDYALDLHNKNSIDLLKNYFNILTKREKEILISRYGLNNTIEKTQKDIANELNISRSYVSRIEKRALTKLLKEFIKNKKD